MGGGDVANGVGAVRGGGVECRKSVQIVHSFWMSTAKGAPLHHGMSEDDSEAIDTTMASLSARHRIVVKMKEICFGRLSVMQKSLQR